MNGFAWTLSYFKERVMSRVLRSRTRVLLCVPHACAGDVMRGLGFGSLLAFQAFARLCALYASGNWFCLCSVLRLFL